MKYDFFLAGRWRNKDAILEVRDALKAVGKSYYCFLENDYSHHKVKFTESADKDAIMDAYESINDWQNDPEIREIFDNDIEGLKKSKAFLLVLPAGKSGHLEAGIAYGYGKPCYAIGEQKETESHYLIFDNIFPTLDDFIKEIS